LTVSIIVIFIITVLQQYQYIAQLYPTLVPNSWNGVALLPDSVKPFNQISRLCTLEIWWKPWTLSSTTIPGIWVKCWTLYGTSATPIWLFDGSAGHCPAPILKVLDTSAN